MTKFIDMGDIRTIMKDLYGKDASIFHEGAHHVHFIDPGVPYHFVSRIFQGRWLTVPHKELNNIVASVIGRAQSRKKFEDVVLYAVVLMSNHIHMMLQGPPDAVTEFVGYVKKEISKRWGDVIDWPGTMWEKYHATALPTQESQVHCLKYILSQGVKEKMVARPEQWPGFHSAKPLATGKPIIGRWVDGTRLGKAMYKEKEKRARAHRAGKKANAKVISKQDYTIEYEVKFSRLPQWQHLSDDQYALRTAALLDEIEQEGRIARKGRRPLGVKKIMAMSRSRRSKLPSQPWFEERKRMIFWANPNAPETKAYVRRYWEFQIAYKLASIQFRNGVLDVEFPPGAFRPVTYCQLVA